MRGNVLRRWRPVAGVVALGLFAFGWSFQGTAEERDVQEPSLVEVSPPLVVSVVSDEISADVTEEVVTEDAASEFIEVEIF